MFGGFSDQLHPGWEPLVDLHSPVKRALERDLTHETLSHSGRFTIRARRPTRVPMRGVVLRRKSGDTHAQCRKTLRSLTNHTGAMQQSDATFPMCSRSKKTEKLQTGQRKQNTTSRRLRVVNGNRPPLGALVDETLTELVGSACGAGERCLTNGTPRTHLSPLSD